MIDPVRQEVAVTASLIVIKVGTHVLAHADGTLNFGRIERLAEEIHRLIERKRRVVLVSSGAVGAGMSHLGMHRRPADLAQLQAVAAVGQTKLIEAYDRTFRQHGRTAAQVLLTADDLDQRARYLNVRNTLFTLLRMGVVPIINENDTVAVDELMTTFGDNDRLAALVTNLLQASLLIILSDVPGLFDGDPEDADSRLVPTVTHIDQHVFSYVSRRSTRLGRGGMASKLKAAHIATLGGENVILASGHTPGVLERILDGQVEGTLFLALGKTMSPWKRWIGFSAQPRGQMILDEGAQQAICHHGRSLLAIGVVAIEGDFAKGDVVSLVDRSGTELARGLSNYSASDLAKIKGLRSNQIAETLGHRPYEEVVHRDNLVLCANPVRPAGPGKEAVGEGGRGGGGEE